MSLLGKKIQMTQIFDEEGNVTPTTILEVGPCVVIQVKDEEKDGYTALQIGFEDMEKNVTKPLQGHFGSAGVKSKRILKEIPLIEGKDFGVGDEITVDIFEGVEKVDVSGTSKGRGFAGTVKRWGFSKGPVSHGSRNVRRPGSIGMAADPSRVLKGKKMPGHMGDKNCTVKNLGLLRIDKERNLLFVKGAVPGPYNGYVFVKKSAV